MKLMIIDGNSIMNRAFYGIKLLSAQNGIYTNAIIGFLNIMDRMMREEKPDAVCVSFDLPAPTFRHLRYEGYKATRHGMPEELAMQMPYIKDVLTAMNIPIFAVEGWEADDVIGTVGKKCREAGWQCVAVTGDRDSLQLIDDSMAIKLIISKPGNTTAELYTENVFTEEYGFAPRGLIDLKALMGDSSDNIPGVPGIGKKTASDLMVQYGSLDKIYEHIDELRDALKNKLLAGKESAYLSYELATIVPEAPIDFDPEKCMIAEPDKIKLKSILEELQCFKLIEQYGLHDTVTAQAENILNDDPMEVSNTFPAIADTMVILFENDKMVVGCEGAIGIAEENIVYLKEAAERCKTLICSDYKALCHKLGISAAVKTENIFDIALAGYAIDPAASSYEIEKLAQRYLSKQIENTPDAHAAAALKLYNAERAELEEKGLKRIYYDIDIPLCPVLADMEQNGCLVDKQALEVFRDHLIKKITDLENKIYFYGGEIFNINSTKKLGEILFEKLQLPSQKKTKTGYSTNAEVLERLRPLHPIVNLILEYRKLTKLQSTYAEGLLKVIGEDGRVRTTFQNMVTATGRLSSTDPNLQNIPVRTDLGSEIRKMFIAQPGYVLVDADYSQIELRVLAHVADDPVMQAAFTGGADFHTVTASQVFGVPIEDVTPQMRRSAKAVNFGIVYGISKWSLAQDLDIDVNDAEAYINSYLNRFSNVQKYMHDVIENARQNGYVETIFGRKRELDDLRSSKFMVRSAAERMALNTPIQGSAADIIKIAMIRVSKSLKQQFPKAKLLLQVHDELIVECPEAEAEAVAELLENEMEHAVALKVPLVAEAKFGHSWYDAK